MTAAADVVRCGGQGELAKKEGFPGIYLRSNALHLETIKLKNTAANKEKRGHGNDDDGDGEMARWR